MNSKNKEPVALITGGVSRLGRCISEHLASGFRVVAHYHNSKDDAKEIIESNSKITPISSDLTLPGAPAKLILDVVSQIGSLHLLVNNAALFFSDTADLVNLAQMKTLNVDAPARLIDAAKPHLSKASGQIINIADIAGIHAYQNYKAYSRSKAALIEYGVSNALTLARKQIRINTICPGLVLPAHEQQNTDTLDHLQSQIPLQRIGKPEDVAELVFFLANSSFITGQIICVDGGRLLNFGAHRRGIP